MKLIIDTNANLVTSTDGGAEETYPLGSKEGFGLISRVWLRAGWDVKYVYGFSWLGRPIIQLPEDVIRIQELIYRVKPDVIIETGVAHGGSLILYASICHAIGRGRVVGVDIEIRSHNKRAIEAHELARYISLVEGTSISDATLAQVKAHIRPNDVVLVILDSNHSRDHVLEELRGYGKFVTEGSYIVACDGIMRDLVGAPRAHPDWATNNPYEAMKQFLAETPDFLLDEPSWPFNESSIDERVSYWPGAYARRSSK